MYMPISVDAAEWAARQELGLTGGSVPVSSGNLLLNDGFETNTGIGGTADHWTSPNSPFGIEEWAAHSDTYGMAVYSWSPDTEGDIYQDYTSASGGQVYTLSMWMSKDAGFSAPAIDLKMQYFDAGMGILGQTSQNIKDLLTTDFQEISIAGTAPAGTAIIRCMLYVIGVDNGTGAMKIDDASLVESAPTLLQNGGFESGSVSGGGSDSWNLGPATAAEPWAAYSDTWGMSIRTWEGTGGYFYQDYGSGQAGTPYTYFIWMSRDAAFTAGVVEVKLEWLNSDMSLISATTEEVAAQLEETWQKFSVLGTAPSGVEYVRCTVGITDMGGSGALKCDDAMLTGETFSEPPLVEASLVYDSSVDISPFLPRWRLVFDDGGTLVTNDVPQAEDLSGDTDSDGMSDGKELYAGCDPDDAESVFATDAGRANGQPAGNIDIHWPSAEGRYYSVYRSTDLMGDSTLLQSHIEATPPENTYSDVLPSETTFYRVEVE